MLRTEFDAMMDPFLITRQAGQRGDRMKFTPEQLEPKLYGTDVVQDLLIKHERWSVLHSLVFRHEGKFYQTIYQAPATEGQSCDPWGYQKEIECARVVPVRQVVVGYREVASPPDTDSLAQRDLINELVEALRDASCRDCGYTIGLEPTHCPDTRHPRDWRGCSNCGGARNLLADIREIWATPEG